MDGLETLPLEQVTLACHGVVSSTSINSNCYRFKLLSWLCTCFQLILWLFVYWDKWVAEQEWFLAFICNMHGQYLFFYKIFLYNIIKILSGWAMVAYITTSTFPRHQQVEARCTTPPFLYNKRNVSILIIHYYQLKFIGKTQFCSSYIFNEFHLLFFNF